MDEKMCHLVGEFNAFSSWNGEFFSIAFLFMEKFFTIYLAISLEREKFQKKDDDIILHPTKWLNVLFPSLCQCVECLVSCATRIPYCSTVLQMQSDLFLLLLLLVVDEK